MFNPVLPGNKWVFPTAEVFRYLGFTLLLLFAAVLSGLVAVTASPLFVGVVAGFIVGAFLLAKPSAAITLIIVVGLTMGAILSMVGPAFDKLTWVVSLLGFFLFIPALLHASRLKHAPAFVHLALAFLLIALATTLVQWHSTAEVFAGIKRAFQAMGLFFALALLPLADREFARWRKLVLVIAILQLPFALYEFLVLIPKRGGLQMGSAVTDVVAGTFGANLAGGSPNSVMALLLLVVLAFLFARWKEGLIKSRHLVFGVPIFLTPVALGEVKIVFIMLPLMLLVLFKQDILKRPAMFVGMIVVGALLMFALGFFYLEFIVSKPLVEIVEETLAYNFYDLGYGGLVLNRTTSLLFWWQQQGLHDPIGLVFGHGLGSSFTAASTFVFGHVAAKWPTYGIDLTTASSLLWDIGIMGFTVFMLVFLAAWRTCNVLLRESPDSFIKAEAAAIRALIPLFVLFVFYSNNQVSLVTMEIVSSLVFGYLAYLHRLHRTGVLS